MHDVAIIGAGPAGLNAALVLGRCRRAVVVFDSGKPRNVASRGLHAFLSRDGTAPLELRKLGRAELAPYSSVRIRDITVTAVVRQDGGFVLTLDDGKSVRSRMLLLATGRTDVVPDKRGFRDLYGRGVYHCPVCDAWEHAGEPFVTYGRGQEAAEFALELLPWSRDVTLCTDGDRSLDAAARERLQRNAVAVIERPVASLLGGEDGMLEHVEFADGTRHRCRALFFDAACPQRSSFAQELGAELDESGGIRCDEHAATSVPGLFVAGNVRCGIHLAITAAAEGAEAALAIHKALLAADLK